MLREVVWSPQPGPQTALIACPVFEVFYGGARGGGKTQGSIGDWLEHSSKYGEQARAMFVRRKFKQLEQVIEDTHKIYSKIGAKYNEQKAKWTMPGGGVLTFRYIERDQDAEEYQGHSYTRLYVEEVTNFPSAAPINLLRGTVRSAAGVPCGMRLTGNPGGPGHHWVKARYITPNPKGWEVLKEVIEGLNGEKQVLERIFIPSKISDNALLWKNDPLYVARLRQTGSEALVNAWLRGDWDLVDGAFFDCWDEEKHVLSAQTWLPKIPPYALRFRAFDWGYARPFCVGWYAVSDGTWGLPDGALLKYREWYGFNGKPNEGLRLNPDQVAHGIRMRELQPDPHYPGRYTEEPIMYGVADPAITIKDGGPSIHETMAINGVMFRRADNKRVPGWAEMRRRLLGEGGRPLLYFLDCCTESIRTIPVMQHDAVDKEDLDTEGEDHAADETRYACVGRPWTEYAPPKPEMFVPPQLPSEMTMNEILEKHFNRKKLERQDAA